MDVREYSVLLSVLGVVRRDLVPDSCKFAIRLWSAWINVRLVIPLYLEGASDLRAGRPAGSLLPGRLRESVNGSILTDVVRCCIVSASIY